MRAKQKKADATYSAAPQFRLSDLQPPTPRLWRGITFVYLTEIVDALHFLSLEFGRSAQGGGSEIGSVQFGFFKPYAADDTVVDVIDGHERAAGAQRYLLPNVKFTLHPLFSATLRGRLREPTISSRLLPNIISNLKTVNP